MSRQLGNVKDNPSVEAVLVWASSARVVFDSGARRSEHATYRCFCEHHEDDGMIGTVVVT